MTILELADKTIKWIAGGYFRWLIALFVLVVTFTWQLRGVSKNLYENVISNKVKYSQYQFLLYWSEVISIRPIHNLSRSHSYKPGHVRIYTEDKNLSSRGATIKFQLRTCFLLSVHIVFILLFAACSYKYNNNYPIFILACLTAVIAVYLYHKTVSTLRQKNWTWKSLVLLTITWLIALNLATVFNITYAMFPFTGTVVLAIFATRYGQSGQMLAAIFCVIGSVMYGILAQIYSKGIGNVDLYVHLFGYNSDNYYELEAALARDINYLIYVFTFYIYLLSQALLPILAFNAGQSKIGIVFQNFVFSLLIYVAFAFSVFMLFAFIIDLKTIDFSKTLNEMNSGAIIMLYGDQSIRRVIIASIIAATLIMPATAFIFAMSAILMALACSPAIQKIAYLVKEVVSESPERGMAFTAALVQSSTTAVLLFIFFSVMLSL